MVAALLFLPPRLGARLRAWFVREGLYTFILRASAPAVGLRAPRGAPDFYAPAVRVAAAFAPWVVILPKPRGLFGRRRGSIDTGVGAVFSGFLGLGAPSALRRRSLGAPLGARESRSSSVSRSVPLDFLAVFSRRLHAFLSARGRDPPGTCPRRGGARGAARSLRLNLAALGPFQCCLHALAFESERLSREAFAKEFGL